MRDTTTMTDELETKTEILSTEIVDDDRLPEGIDETARRTYEELEAKASSENTDESVHGDQGEEDQKPNDEDIKKAASTLAKAKGTKKRQVIEKPDLSVTTPQPAQDVVTESAKIPAPARFNASEKEWFNKQDPIVQKHVNDVFSGMQSHFTKQTQELAAQKARYGEIEELVTHYTPRWNLQGLSPVQAMRELCAIQDMIVKDPISGFDHAMRRAGVTPEQVYQYRNQTGGHQQPQAQAPAPHYNTLTREDVLSILREQETQRGYNSELQSGVSEVEALKNSMDQAGRYLYPELHDPAQVNGLKPFVDSVKKITPGIGWGEATKRAIIAYRSLQANNYGNLPASQKVSTQQEIETAKRASVSVKPRGNGAYSTIAPAPKGQPVRKTAEILYDQIFGKD